MADSTTDINNKLATIEQRLDRARGANTILESQVSRTIDQLIVKGQGLDSVIKSVNASLLNTVNRLGIVNPLVNQLLGSNKTTIGGVDDSVIGSLGSSLSSFFGSLFGASESSSSPVASPITGRAISPADVPPSNSFSRSSSQISATLADAVARGNLLR